jgi:endonuclease/exonuclease/phosphatase family metal-dependent hydrolase
MDGRARARAFAVALLAGLIALVALVAAPGVDAKPKKKKAVPVKVMTRNIFLGADLGPALAANSFEEFTRANGNILAEVDQTNFPLRAQALAAEIVGHKPDLVGLQEVAWWRTNPTPGAPAQGPDGQFTANDTRYDFLQLLLDQVSAQGGDYTPAVVKTEFDFEAPADTDNNSSTGLAGGDIQGRLTMRDVILVNDDSKVKAKLKNPQTGTFNSLFTPNISGIDVPVTRGWTAGDVTVKKGKGKKKVKKTFRFVNSHFEAFDDETQVPSIRAQQAAQLLAEPANAKKALILGDFNSDVPGVQPGDDQAYQTLLNGGFTERATDERTSCCVNNLFTSPPTQFDHRVDHIMSNRSKKKVKLVRSEIVGKSMVNGLYPSDHAGVVSKLKLK